MSQNMSTIVDVLPLLSTDAVRDRCTRILQAAYAGKTKHFQLVPQRLEAVADLVVGVTRRDYPSLEIPVHSRWGHFEVGGVNRPHLLTSHSTNRFEVAKSMIDLAMVSTITDAGAGKWSFTEKQTGQRHARSEGLAVAAYRAMEAGLFSSDPSNPWRADAEALCSITNEQLAAAFQHSDKNPLIGFEARADLLRRLGQAAAAQPIFFGEPARLGNLLDYFGREGRTVEAADIVFTLLRSLNAVWPGRIKIGGISLGDCGRHSLIAGDQIVPFHKLIQWMAYSFFEPLERAGLMVVNPNRMTGLGEYRNAGLFTDLGVLVPCHAELVTTWLDPMSEAVVEWRALTVALLDRLHPMVCHRLGLNKEQFPLAKMLQGGTWQAGREIAKELREDGGPPLLIKSDGTLF